MAQALLPAIRTIIAYFFAPKTLYFSASKESLFLPSPKTPLKPYITVSRNLYSTATLIHNNQDQRFLASNGTFQNYNSGTAIAAIVTSIGGPAATVRIVRLSGPSAAEIASRVLRPLRKKKKKQKSNKNGEGLHDWRPISHVVDYGVVLDHEGNVIDEVFSFAFSTASYSCPKTASSPTCFLSFSIHFNCNCKPRISLSCIHTRELLFCTYRSLIFVLLLHRYSPRTIACILFSAKPAADLEFES